MKSRREREHEELMRLRREQPTQPTVDWEEASRCPTCEVAMKTVRGPFTLEKNLTAKGYYLQCMNKERCRQADLPPFFVEVLADGRVPIRLPGPKEYDMPLLSKEEQARWDEYHRRQYEGTLRGDELRRD